MADLTASAIGTKVIVEANDNNVLEVAREILPAVFGLKSPGALPKRLYAIQVFEAWCVDKRNSHWCLCRTNWYGSMPSIFKRLQLLRRGPEALRFSWYLLGVHGSDEAERSLGVKGMAARLRAAKRPWQPADVLKLEEVRTLRLIF